MTKVVIEAGACGFSAVVSARKNDRRSVTVTITTECIELSKMAEHLETLHLRDILKIPVAANPVFEAASRYHVHPGCPVPCAVIKAAEVELELSLPRNPTITFATDE
ncbi:MAG: hypothetical protein V1793_01060 [Pseudomonadota bacterium]